MADNNICSIIPASTWQNVLSSPEKFASVMSSGAVVLGAIAAIGTLIFVGIKNVNAQWNENFRDLYDEFWSDQSVALARKYVMYDQEYEKIREILSEVAVELTEARAVEFTDDQISMIEIIDRFFSKCTQFALLSDGVFISYKRKQFRSVFLSYWFANINSRIELKNYMKSQWPTLSREYLIHEREQNLEKARRERRNAVSAFCAQALPPLRRLFEKIHRRD